MRGGAGQAARARAALGAIARPHRVALAALLVVALGLRLYGLDWDEGNLFHPDERKLLMVADGLRFPWREPTALLRADSPWNPAFFSYGSLPIYLLRVVGEALSPLRSGLTTLEGSYILGRALSALADTGTVLLTYLLGRTLYDRRVGMLAAGLLALAVLPIQLAHYYGVDTLLTLLVTAALLAMTRVAEGPTRSGALLLGALWGLALATKLTAALLAVPILVTWVLAGPAAPPVGEPRVRLPWGALSGLGVTALWALAAFLLVEPYALLDVARFLGDAAFEAGMASGAADVPYARQYAGTARYLYPLEQLLVWWLGPPLGVAALAGSGAAVVVAVRRVLRGRPCGPRAVPPVWLLAYLGVTGALHAKFGRYLLPIVPVLCLYAAWALVALVRSGTARGRAARGAAVAVLAAVVVWSAAYALAYTNVYRERHPWLRATEWICAHVPPGSTLLVEHWDDALPVPQVREGSYCFLDYHHEWLPLYDDDTPAKAEGLARALERGDCIVISSHRLYGSIGRLRERYPLTRRYYELLFSGRLGYELVHHEATYASLLGVSLVHDTFGPAGLAPPRALAEAVARRPALRPGRADESYAVYDHPMPMVFRRTREIPREALLALLIGDAEAAGAP